MGVPEREQSDRRGEAGQSAPGTRGDQGAPGVELSQRCLDVELTTRIHTMSWGHASQASVFRTVSLFFCMPESICIMALLPGLFTVAPILQNSGCTRPVFLTSALVFGRYVPLEQLGIDAI